MKIIEPNLTLDNMQLGAALAQSKRWSPRRLLKFRIISAFLLILIGIHGLSVLSTIQFFRHFTEIGLILNIISCLLLITVSLKEKHRPIELDAVSLERERKGLEEEEEAQNKSLLFKGTLLAYELSFSFEFVITVVFWVVLVPFAPDVDAQLNHDLPTKFTISLILYWAEVHLVPMVLTAMEVYYNSISFDKRHWAVPVGVVFLYIITDIVVTRHRQIPAYYIAPWDDMISYVVAFFALGVVFAGFFVGAAIAQKKKGKIESVYKKSM